MADARQKSAWWQTAHLMCLLANINRGKGRRPFEPRDFFPFDRSESTRDIPLGKGTIESLKVFM